MNNVFTDVKDMYIKYDMITGNEKPNIPSNINERIAHLKEELQETIDAVEANDILETIDGLIDLMVIASGTLAQMGITGQWHWEEVLRANNEKVRGVSPKRNHTVDIIKPEGWTPPNHERIMKWYKK